MGTPTPIWNGLLERTASYTPESYDIDNKGDIQVIVLFEQDQNVQRNGSESDTGYIDTVIDAMLAQASISPETVSVRMARRAVRFRVSSYVLRPSSAVFKELLDHHVGSPGAASQAQFPTCIPIWNDDPVIMAMVLYMIHQDEPDPAADNNFIRSLFPDQDLSLDQVDLTTIARIAVIAEKYHLHAAMDRYITRWIDNLWNHKDESSTTEMLTWVWITWVFELTHYFEVATENLAKNSTRSLEMDNELQYPIPEPIINAINERRLEALTDLYALFCALMNSHREALDGYQTRPKDKSSLHKTEATMAFCLGLLTLRGTQIRFWPGHDPDFKGISYAHVSNTLRLEGDSIPSGTQGDSGFNEQHTCWCQFQDLLDCLKAQEWGQDIGSFNSEHRRPIFTY